MNEGSNGSSDDAEIRYEGYSDYQSVSNRVTASIDNAVDAYAMIDSLHAENARISQREAAMARRHMLSAAIKLLPEIKENSNGSEEDEGQDIFSQIYERWVETGTEEFGPFLEELKKVQFQKEAPPWLSQFAQDIRRAGWEIGYLQAGRTVKDENLDPADEQAQEMFS